MESKTIFSIVKDINKKISHKKTPKDPIFSIIKKPKPLWSIDDTSFLISLTIIKDLYPMGDEKYNTLKNNYLPQKTFRDIENKKNELEDKIKEIKSKILLETCCQCGDN
ncbi:MAG: hypothetical protein MJ252_24015, partial [archaeon]|nr:hypothetical protein [archaeon]